MNTNQLLISLTLILYPLTCISMNRTNLNTDYWIIDYKTASKKEKRFEKATKKQLLQLNQTLTTIEANAPQEKLKLPLEMYIKIQNQLTPGPKQLITSFQKITLTNQETQTLMLIEQKQKSIENFNQTVEEYQTVLLKSHLLKEEIKKQKTKIAELQLTQKKIKNTYKQEHQKRRKQLTKPSSIQPQKPSVKTFEKTNTTQYTKHKQPAPIQSFIRKKFAALKILFKLYNVQKEADLKKILYDICWETKENFLENRINYSCTFEYNATTNELEIFTDDYENAANDDETSDSDHDLEISATVLPQ